MAPKRTTRSNARAGEASSRAVPERSAALPPLARLLEIARAAAVAGGARTLEYYGGRVVAELKPDGSPVTPADRSSEAEIRRHILREFPTHTIVGEEGGVRAGDPRVRWIVDPLDGTKSFVHGVPLYSVLVAVEVEGVPSVGVIHNPVLKDTVEAAVGLGCRWNGRKAHVSETERLSDATVLTTSVRALESEGVSFQRIYSATRTQRGWGDGYGFSLVATGRADAMVDVGLHLWDCAPLLPVLEEAGGRFTDFAGARTLASEDFIGSNGRLHAGLLELVRAR